MRAAAAAGLLALQLAGPAAAQWPSTWIVHRDPAPAMGVVAWQPALAGEMGVAPHLSIGCRPGMPWSLAVTFPRPTVSEMQRYELEWYVRPNRGGFVTFTGAGGGRSLGVEGPLAVEIIAAMAVGTHVAIALPRGTGDPFVAETGGLADVLRTMREAGCGDGPG